MKRFLTIFVERLIKPITKISKDYLLHFIAGFILSSFIVIVFPDVAPVGFFVGALAGILKEMIDKYLYNKIDGWDILATCIGAVVPVLFSLI